MPIGIIAGARGNRVKTQFSIQRNGFHVGRPHFQNDCENPTRARGIQTLRYEPGADAALAPLRVYRDPEYVSFLCDETKEDITDDPLFTVGRYRANDPTVCGCRR